MTQVINTNIMSLNAQRNLNTNSASLATSIQRLSSGLRVNSAKDDAAGLAIAERMNSQVRGMNVGIRNSNDAISMAQTGEAALGKITDMAQRMRELAVQSANATNTSDDRANLDAEFQQLGQEIGRTLTSTKFNGKAILGSDGANTMTFQVGANNSSTNDQISVTMKDLTADASVSGVIGTGGTGAIKIDGADATNATAAMDKIDSMLKTMSTQRAAFGAAQNRFENAISVQSAAVENQTAARSRIMDADFASETANLTRGQILQQAGTAMLSQANQLPNGVLSLLR